MNHVEFLKSELPNTNAIQILLYIGIFDENIDLVRFALENGADPNMSMSNIQHTILTGWGYLNDRCSSPTSIKDI
tara:strand:- start:182 stop:406 length:225 start_codon:yes stop_codon:yes gene_type:complete